MYKRERHEVFDDDGHYHTGDRVRLEDGLCFFTGRVTEMIKTQGAKQFLIAGAALTAKRQVSRKPS